MISQNNYRPLFYFFTAFLVTYAFWFGGAYLSFQAQPGGLHMLLMLPGLMTPFVIALGLVVKAKNPQMRQDLRNRLTNLRLFRISSLPTFFLMMPLSVLLSILLSLPFGGSLAQFQLAEEFSFSSGFVPVFLLLLLAATFEELGWRGYAFDSLQSRFSYFKASMIFSLLWSLWHFPLIFVKDSYQYEIFQNNIWFGVNFFISIIPMGLLISWICAKNGKSILAAILFHLIINLSQEMLNISQTTKCIQTVVLTIIAMGVIVWDKELFFSTRHLKKQSQKAAS
ncbi:MAG: CPBP family intramembrane metalloprotease [Deltaproteobacteria bacterium]|nr:CPBP family intramembrane metalloprotease [Deltaproteobacteria bacterium]NCP03726.1 CPBP family intramembrane metalloprotease [Deltaproteobacteria bacterium]